ncbi:MAG: aminotransferase class V-fold PLP-dependent enzyme [Roseitalea sp.]|jgi:selenocysteine lyase/cysteine desulfurase|nr:aminotransferase class V-fold PLP-dependent enzyme [Roseitalea sp.]MBO6721691.1 aminotransferase class V-fold PLP-dependent enzyme [Roseitalea sp.]MBO6743521.1 aminotransferase class V-fold PLP-dependent enzyme [Roseitalea sp.]
MSVFDEFRASLAAGDPVEAQRTGLIGDGMAFQTPYGEKPLLYADYVASGRALAQIEYFAARRVLPFYANSHTEASHCGQAMTRMRAEARAVIADAVNAGPDCHTVFTGSGATSGVNRIVGLLDIARRVASGERVVVLIGPYEHHSNILPWRESGAQVREIGEAAGGGADLAMLEAELVAARNADLIVGSFSAASNVTGILTDPDPVTRLLKAHGALAVWDYACGAPYLEMDMTPGADCAKDAIVFSPHKFIGGPGASGVMVVRDTIVARATPTAPGGGTVTFVSPWDHVYSASVEAREEAGTPNVVGDIRVALAMIARDVVGCDRIAVRNAMLRKRAIDAWRDVPGIELLGKTMTDGQLPIFSFRVAGPDGERVHHQLFTRMLSDVLGIQARGGCACAGSYGHRLLGIDPRRSKDLFGRIGAGHELEKPGWVRLNLSHLMTDDKADAIIDGVAWLAARCDRFIDDYEADPLTARFRHKAASPDLSSVAVAAA